MKRDEHTVDLRNTAPISLQAEAYGVLRDLQRGETLALLMKEHPGLTMKSLDIGLRHKFAWTISQGADGWRVDVRHIADATPRDVLELLAPFFRSPSMPAEPIEIMLREHQEILRQLGLIDETLAADQPDATELGAFCAILSGSLAKHEHREETNVFAVWRSVWSQKTAAERSDMMSRTAIALAGNGG